MTTRQMLIAGIVINTAVLLRAGGRASGLGRYPGSGFGVPACARA